MPRSAKATEALTRPLAGAPGVGPATAARLARLLGRPDPRVVDLLWLLPVAAFDPRPRLSLGPEDDGATVTVAMEVLGHRPRVRAAQPYRVLGRGAGAKLELVFFGAKAEHLAQRLLFEARYLVRGRLKRSGASWQIAHPEVLPERQAEGALVPVYPLAAGLTRRAVAALITHLLEGAAELPEWADARLVARERWPGWRQAIRDAHAPSEASGLAPTAGARRRLAYDELLAAQLALEIVRRDVGGRPGRALAGDGRLRAELRRALPFVPTASQERAMAEIAADLAAPAPMTRLLQGDVGSGKTLVALVTMLQAVEAGTQAAMMAPTELLARQHHATLASLTAPLGLTVELITGREPAAARRHAAARVAAGRSRLAVGTQALFQDATTFADLGLAVIDEQHRFGVGQRLALVGRGRAVDLLLTTATPIPRSLLLAAHGDIAVSSLREKPAGRQKVTTRVMSSARLDELLSAVARACDAGERVFWVCPLVEEGASGDLAAATARHAVLLEVLGPRVGLVHGRLDGDAKAKAFAAFRDGAVSVLVATTVIEVGVDVPEASIVVIEGAERFGLAQLHQLRGRVGRGAKAASCVLVYETPLSATARARLETLRTTDDGFTIAEADLRLRGPGEVLGTRQSGLPRFRLADLEAHADLLPVARDDARVALERDPKLTSPRGRALRLLLELFERGDAVRFLTAG